MEIRALSQLDQRKLGTAEHPIYQAIINSFRDFTNQRKRFDGPAFGSANDEGWFGLLI
jgi:hypothetical protein